MLLPYICANQPELKKFSPMKTGFITGLLILPLYLSAQLCSPLCYEGFQYTDDTPLNGGNGGSGWSSVWYVQNDNNQVPGYQIEETPLLTWLDLQTNGLAAGGGHAYLTAGRNLDVNDGGAFDAWLNTQGQIGAPGTRLFFSCLIAKRQNNNEPVVLTLHQNNLAWYANNPDPKVMFGYFGADSNNGGNRYWSINTGSGVIQSAVPLTIGNAALFILEMVFSADSTEVHFYINPTEIATVMPPAPAYSYTYPSAFYFRSLAYYAGSSQGQSAIDEIRISDTYRCATPDSDVEVNNPPIAFFTASVTTGNAPLQIEFDASGSSDDGPIVSYEWDFDDGTSGEGVTISHVFTYPTRMSVSLRVVDEHGSNNTFVLPVTVYDENGHISCLSSISMLQLASCGQDDGSFRAVDDMGWVNTFTLRNEAETILNPSSDNGYQAIWQLLPAGSYQLMATGLYGCSDTFDLVITVDSNTCAGWDPPPCQLQIGTNISGIRYWDVERAFSDFKWYSDEFFTYNSNGSGPWNTGLMPEIPVDVQGYPLEIPYPTTGGLQHVRLVISANGHMLPGDYVLLYEGTGQFTPGGNMAFSDVSPGRIAFSIYDTGNIWLHLTSSQSGDHVRHIRILRAADEAVYTPEQPFYEGFLNRLSHFSCIRFMDWGNTNGSPHVGWENRAQPDYHRQSTDRGVAYEYMIRLANLLHKDAWICVPHAADENYIRQMARLFRDSLDASLTIYLEYSNEVWNWQFEQAHYNDQTNRPSIISYPRAYTDKSLRVFQIWYEEFGNAAPARIKRVLATQNTYHWVGEQILAHSGGAFDCFSPTSYFGYNPDACGIQAGSDALDIIQCAREQYRNYADAYRQEYENGKLYGAEIINYEGGQHITHNPATVPWQQAIYDSQIHPEMYDMYVELLDSIRTWGSALHMNFSFASPRESVYGSWGVLEDIDQDLSMLPAPKWQALIDNLHPLPEPVIIGNPDVCAGEPIVYEVAPGPPGSIYIWTVIGGVILSGQGTASVTVQWTGSGQGSLQVEMTYP